MTSPVITAEMVRARLLYVKAAGRLAWLSRPRSDFGDANKRSIWNNRYAGEWAGTIGAKGYRVIKIFGKDLKASRLTWVYHFGEWPETVDHIDGDILNDAIDNLRDVPQALNCQNKALSSRNKTGYHGIYRDGETIRAQINVAGRRVYLGSFDTIEDAVAARKSAEQRFGFHPNHGREARP